MGQQDIDTIWGSTGAVTDPGTVKANLGWVVEVPPHQYQNWWQNRADQWMEYSQQSGIEEWHAQVIYRDNGLAMGSDGEVYQSQQAANLNHNPVGDDGTWWFPRVSPFTGEYVTAQTAMTGDTTYSFAHGLPSTPNSFSGYVIATDSSPFGYTTGDVVPFDSLVFDQVADNDGIGIRADATNLSICVGSHLGAFRHNNQTIISLQPPEWAFVVRAWTT